MTDPHERTPQEREAARLERERRRSRALQADVDDPEPRYEDYERPAENGDGDGHADDELPSGTRRVGWRERSAASAPARHRRTHRPPRPHRAPRADAQPSAHSRTRRYLGRGLAMLLLIVVAAAIWFCVELFQPFHGTGHGRVTVRVPPRLGAHEVGDLLARSGVVSSGFFFYLRAKLDGDTGKLYAGTYHLKRDMSYGQVLKILTTPPPKIPVTNVTIIPGDTRAEVSARLHAEHIPGSYAAATRFSRLLRPTWYGAPRNTPSLEGFLFPDTYQLRSPISIKALVVDQLMEFRRVFSQVNLSYAHSHNLTAYDVLIIASIVEKEASTVKDRPLVASVIYNRLKDGIPLGMDSTTRYEFNDYTKPLTNSQLAAQSPYNTRLHQGLTPTPIDSPGLASIQAAADPARTNYLYFVVKPCGNGEMVFSSNYSQFLADSARYQQARAARGGNAPNKC